MTTIRLEVESMVPNHRLAPVIAEGRGRYQLALTALQHRLVYTIAFAIQSPSISALKDVFCDPIVETLITAEGDDPVWTPAPTFVVDVSYRPGVTDNAGNSAAEALGIIGHPGRVGSGGLYLLYGDLDAGAVATFARACLANPLIQTIKILSWEDMLATNRFATPTLPQVRLSATAAVETIAIEQPLLTLKALSEQKFWALSETELACIQRHYASIGRAPTDVEMEVIAQTWSEHCKHKIFAATIRYREQTRASGPVLGDQIIRSLYRTYIKAATQSIADKRPLDWLISVFSDNAGIVRFDPYVDLCIKVETHNSPSALDPYGGALTGILGVNRDILGCGMGARPIANTDVFCLADPAMPRAGEAPYMPAALKAPRHILEGVHRGVADGGNKSGIPTVNGAIFFDPDYAGKPLVFVGTVGVMPPTLADGRLSAAKYTQAGDRIVMVGGAIGADGIHGATFSSMELDESPPATAVQIGDPLTQKRVSDFLLEARDQGLFSGVTDNGAGGLSSSVGEMATITGGALIDLALCPVKYPGLKPYELMISESQERMTLSVPPEQVALLLDLARRRGVVATDVGQFTNDGQLTVLYDGQKVGCLDLAFLHDGLPPMELDAVWQGPRVPKPWSAKTRLIDTRLQEPSLQQALLQLLQAPNIASKEDWVRRYDHEVQAATHIKPFVGSKGDGPSNSGIIWLEPHGGDPSGAVAVGCGLAPRLSFVDPYLMAQVAVDEAIRNVVIGGGDVDRCCLLDNFCWPDPVQSDKSPDGTRKLAELVRACAGLDAICRAYGTPLVSGKDSMKNDYRGQNSIGETLVISVPPTLMITAMAHVRMGSAVTSDFKADGDVIYLLGGIGAGLAGSEWSQQCIFETLQAPKINLAKNLTLYRLYRDAARRGLIQSGHDVSDGGWLIAVAESCIGGRLGAQLEGQFSQEQLFNEAPGRFVISVAAEKHQDFEQHFAAADLLRLGTITKTPSLSLMEANWALPDLISVWKSGASV
jgi:phosphoribosylformylglycinamidine synthase